MKLGLLHEVDWGQAGAMLAQSDDNEQIAFLRAFVRECNTWGTRLQVERQLAMVNMKLTPDERETLKMLSYQEGC